MQLKLIICIVVCYSVLPSTYSVIQYKKRSPTPPPRIAHHFSSPYPKSKWNQAPRQPPSRPFMRPIPVHMASYKVPIVARPPKNNPPLVPTKNLIFPSTIWKSPTSVYRPPVEKPFLTSPPVTQPYEFQFQKEVIPTIKQIGEKGPIHTIPAPNLTPADKPEGILEEPFQKHTYQQFKPQEISSNSIATHSNLYSGNSFPHSSILNAQALPLVAEHQYQVTENAEATDTTQQKKIYFAPDPDQKLQLNNYAESSTNFRLSPQELYQLLTVPQTQLLDNYGMSVLPASHFPTQSINIPQYVQPGTSYFNQIPEVSQQVKDNFKPQFHTFNYEEQNNQPQKNYVQSRVTAEYNIEPEMAESKFKISVQNPQDALAQTQYIQQYFANRVDNNIQNNLEETTKESEILNRLSAKNEELPSFYTTLPNKKAADALATLHSAGSFNNQLKQQQEINQNKQMTIYVPDEESYEELDVHSSEEKADAKTINSQGIKVFETTHLQNSDNLEFEDYSEESASSKSDGERVQNYEQFGNKIKSKITR